MNSDATALRGYHERTKHSAASVRNSGHFLDWENQPLPFKIYPELTPIPLPRDWQESTNPALDILSAPASPVRPITLTLVELARLLHYGAGIIRTKIYPNGATHDFRAAACTGALYHIDLYLVCGALPDLDAGVYHFGPHDFSLRQLRRGDYRDVVVGATAEDPAIVAAPAVLISASTYWRNAWKYQSRAYRHCYWDDGTILANLLAVAAARHIPAQVVLGFVDQRINDLLALDTQRESALSLVALGTNDGARPPAAPALEALQLETAPLSKHEVDYPAIRDAHAASSLATVDDVRAWRGDTPRSDPATTGQANFAMRPMQPPSLLTIEATIRKRGSARQFARHSIRVEQLATMLIAACSERPVGALNDVYVIVNAVDQLPAGTYVYHPAPQELEQLRTGEFRREATYLDLGQDLAGDASVNFYMLADLEPLFGRYGNRAYRTAQLDGAIIGGRLYLAAYALGLGATGLTFFDDDVTEFLSPHARGKSVMFLVAAGVKA